MIIDKEKILFHAIYVFILLLIMFSNFYPQQKEEYEINKYVDSYTKIENVNFEDIGSVPVLGIYLYRIGGGKIYNNYETINYSIIVFAESNGEKEQYLFENDRLAPGFYASYYDYDIKDVNYKFVYQIRVPLECTNLTAYNYDVNYHFVIVVNDEYNDDSPKYYVGFSIKKNN